jgi:pimeloyl-ACP methyl ester carboxylesterase
MKSSKNVFVALLILGSCGCGHLATVKTIEPRVPTVAASEERLMAARQHLAAAERTEPFIALGHDVSAAKLSLSMLEQRPDDSAAVSLYNFSVARIVENVERTRLQPWQRKINIVSAGTTYTLTTPKPVDPEHDPSRYDLLPIDGLSISGKFFTTHPIIGGIGAPLVAVGRAENPHFRQEYKLRRTYAPVTAVIRFSGQKAELVFVDPMKSEQAVLGGRTFPLAVDLRAAAAMAIARERPERLGLSRVMDPQKHADTARLVQLQQYDPNRTPVIFVHGLQETGASWAPMIDALRDDAGIRKNYQFWFYSYPSGYPYPYSAALFRRDLDGIKRAFPDHKRVVLIGHSMGGMICRLTITDSGDKVWRDYFATPPNKTPLPNETRKMAEDVFIFRHRPEVKRAIFISTPHRGSDLAKSWIGRIGAAFVRTPPLFTPLYRAVKPLLIADPAVRPLERMPNSVDTLEPNDRFVRAVNKIPITSGIPYNSIIGDRGRGDSPNSSDGVVPYWSSHLDGAESELIVNSGHGAQYNQQAIREVERILKANSAARN